MLEETVMPRTSRLAAIAMVWTVLLISALSTLTGCNTTAGLGQDVSATGHAVTDSANTVKSKM
jgi:predicted small secreted protein